jgi:quercetin dioxygenase-like cupin family protein
VALLETRPYVRPAADGEIVEPFGLRVSVKATSTDTGGSFNLFEITAPPDFATALHIHYTKDVAVFVLEGELAIYWGDVSRRAGPGSWAFIPRGTPHGFRCGRQSSTRVLYFAVPAGLDGFIRQRVLDGGGPDWVVAAALHKIEVIGPLPDKIVSPPAPATTGSGGK